MIYRRFLLKQLPAYLITGCLCAALLGTNIWMARTNARLSFMVDRLESLPAKKLQVSAETKQLRSMLAEIKHAIPADAGVENGLHQVLLGIDQARGTLSGGSITIGEPMLGGEDVTVPLDLSFAYDGYGPLLKRIGAMEGRAFPYFRYSSFVFDRGTTVAGNCLLKGELISPAGVFK